MRMWKLILASLSCLTACDEAKTTYLVPEVPADLRRPCDISDRQAKTLRQLAVLATEHLNAAQCANARIEAIDEILSAAEAQASQD